RPRTWRLGWWSSAVPRAVSPSGRTTRPGSSRACCWRHGESSSSGPGSTARRASSWRWSPRTGSGRWRPTAGSRPGCARTRGGPGWFEGCEWLHLSGYALLAEPIAEATLAAARLARGRGARIAVDLSSWSAIRAYGADRFRANLDAVAPDVVFANEPEWEMVGGAYALAETAVVKRGSRGLELRTAGGVEEHAPLAAEVVDTTGAGDALAAGFLVGGIELGLEAAARCVGRLGAVPS